jgi:hypothetical protein
MANDMLGNAAAVQQAADLLGAAADALRDRRRKDFEAGLVSADEAFRSVSEETTLREQSTKLFVRANTFVLKASQGDQSELESAISQANAAIARIAKFRDALKILAGLIALAGAIVSGQPKAIVGAIAGLKDSTA